MPKNAKVLFCIMFFLSFLTISVVSDLAPPLEMMTPPFSPTPVMASEEENVDTLNVHPLNRYDITESGWGTKIVSSGILNLTDTGDGSTDYYLMMRGLRSLDGKIKLRLKSDVSGSDGGYFIFGICTEEDQYKEIYLTSGVVDGNYSGTSIAYRDEDSNYRTAKTLTGTERMYDEVWYRLELDYDILKSEFSIKCEFDNGTDVFDYSEHELFSYRPYVFGGMDLQFYFKAVSTTSGTVNSYYVDYIEAPFKEREWVQSTTPGDDDWLEDSWDAAYVQGDSDIDAASVWTLTVPYLDGFSGTMSGEFSDITLLDGSASEEAWMSLSLYAIDADDGGTHQVHGVRIRLWEDAGGVTQYSSVILIENGATPYSKSVTGVTNYKPKVGFTFTLSDDRSKSTLKVRFWPDAESEVYYDYNLEVDISDCADDPSSEFMIQAYYHCDFLHAIEFEGMIDSFEMRDRDIFMDLVQPVVIGVLGWLAGVFGAILIPLFRFLGGLLRGVGDIIKLAIEALEPLLGLIEEAVDALAPLFDALIDYFLTLIGDFIDDVIAWCLTILADIFELITEIAFWGWDTFWVTTLGFSSAPDLLAIVYALGTGFIQLIIGIPGFVSDFGFYVQNTWDMLAWLGVTYFLILPVIQAGSVGDFFEIMLDHFGKDITMGLSFFGIHIPIPAGLVWLLVLIVGPLAGTSYVGFLP